MNNRRDFLKATLAGASALSVAPNIFANSTAAGKAPQRFIFIHRGNGLPPNTLVPPTFSDKLKEADKKKESLEVDLDKHELPDWLKPVSKHQADMTLLQGVSGRG